MKIDYAARSETGCVRRRNEDAFWIGPPGPPGPSGGPDLSRLWMAVADGMGGQPGGDEASRLAISAVRAAMAESETASPEFHLGSIFRQASAEIERRWRGEAALREMGTTLSVAILEGGLAYLGHIGDTRIHWIRGQAVVQITRDHTVAQDLVEAGALSVAEAEHHPTSHILTRCLGVCGGQAPDLLLTPLRLQAGDRLLLSSDGLGKAVSPEELQSAVAEGASKEVVDKLVETAIAAGAPDNVTLALATILDPGPVEPGIPFQVLRHPFTPRWNRPPDPS